MEVDHFCMQQGVYPVAGCKLCTKGRVLSENSGIWPYHTYLAILATWDPWNT